MGKNIVQKIFEAHKISGEIKEGSLVGLKVDQVYTQDATGTMAWLEFEAIGIDRVKVPLAVSYVDHNMLQSNFMNADDHLFLQTAAQRFGAYFSKPGNGICHQVHLERFALPGKIALGTDSHTPTGGGMGMIAIGVGGLEAATVMAGAAFEINMPKVVRINLRGRLQRPWVTAMDVILTLLKMLTVKGGVGKIFEYGGDGVKDLNVTERATITNMGAELGATTSIFPSDEKTLAYLKAQGREKDWVEIKADDDAEYAEIIELNLSAIEPMIAQPHSPDNVVTIREISGKKVNQVCIGSCTNSSYQAMKTVASILRGNTVAEWVNLLINPGSKQVYEMLSREGLIADMISAGARILEASCGPCIGMGGAPGSGHVSIRSYNRNFHGRSGTKDAYVYLASPIACAVMAIKGEIIDPRDVGIRIDETREPDKFLINDNLIIPPKPNTKDIKIIKGPNIKEVPVKEPLKKNIDAEVLLKLGNNITTDDIMPAGSKVLPFRSNIPAISEFVFENIDRTFSKRAMEAKESGGGIIIGGENYGQGSSREHAAIAPMYLGLQAVIAKSFARIHRANLINFGVLPLLFKSESDYDKIEQGHRLLIRDVIISIKGEQNFKVDNITKGYTFEVISNLNDREKELILKGGLLPYVRR
ncbi:aconitate hydratase [Dissulfurispira thermophila]|uniref:Aconitate hydratase A n=1 Tax=Dissulfurispira thermophila TaxID=2715679 RepID=A0A7G1GYG3_9BACT|nr:aconitate hydratase [Dissulfurispira thermophila]BCB95404.1 aconitate hydratase [Dissulfurispira thermophila]